MDVHLTTGHVYVLTPTLEFETAKQQATDQRLKVVAGGLGGLLSRPKPEEVDLAYSEVRFEAFWHIVCAVHYEFEHNKNFVVPVTGVEVRKVTILGQEFEVAAQPAAQPGFLQQIGIGGAARTFSVPGVEHCLDENRQERYLEAAVGQPLQAGPEYVKKDKTELADLSTLMSGDALVVPPQLSALKIAKTLLATMTKQIQADKILEESTRIETLDLYFRPVYAFEFAWKPKNKTGVAEYDAVLGSMINGKALHTRSDKPISHAELFDINADTAGSLIPTAAGNVNLIVE